MLRTLSRKLSRPNTKESDHGVTMTPSISTSALVTYREMEGYGAQIPVCSMTTYTEKSRIIGYQKMYLESECNAMVGTAANSLQRH